MQRLSVLLFAVVLIVGFVGHVADAGQTANAQDGPSFDCTKASGEVETLVCSDSGLAALDRRLAEVYAAALKEWPADIAAEQRAFQRGWIGGRNECWQSSDVRRCTERSYQTRIAELQIKSGQLMAPTPVGLACSGGADQPVTVSYYSETEPSSAVVTIGPDQVIAFRERMGSGTKYAADNVELLEHQGAVTVTWFGTALNCRVREAAR